MPRTKLLICAPRLFATGQNGGGERYVTEFINATIRRGNYDLSVVTGSGYRGLVSRNVGDLDQTVPMTFRSFLQAVRENDTVHYFQIDSHLSDLVILGSMFCKTRVVATDLGGGWRTGGRFFGTRRYRFIDALAAISETSVKDLAWPAERPSAIIYGGGDHLLARSIDTPAKAYDFVFVGRLIRHKGLHMLIRALPPGTRCLIAGAPLDAEYLEELQTMQSPGAVDFLLAPSDEEVVHAYRSANWSVSPTLATMDGRALRRPELLGLSPIESLALGTPAIMSNIPAYAELAAAVDMPTFVADDIESLREVLSQAVTNSRDVSLAIHTLSWDATAARTEPLY